MAKPKILVFASGGKKSDSGGSGFQKLVEASRGGSLDADIVGVVSNHLNGGVRTRADNLGVSFVYFPGPWTAEKYKQIAIESGADFFALSGWLKLVVGFDPRTPFNSTTTINIHPGKLPGFGGTGMHGHHVHEAAIAAKKAGKITYSAVSMHFVTEDGYDLGPVFFCCNVEIKDNDTAETLAARVNAQEHKWQPWVTNFVVNRKITWDGLDPASLQLPDGYSIERDA